MTTDGCSNFTHCPRAREYFLYRLLAYLDQMLIDERAQEKYRDQSRHRQASTPGSGVGYAVNNPFSAMWGVMPYSFAPQTPLQSSMQHAENASKRRDLYLRALLNGVSMTLRNSQEHTLLPLMKMSRLDHTMAELLRNDAISDCSDRDALYSAVLSCLEAMASNPHLVEFYVSPRDEIVATDGLEKIVLGQGRRIKAKVDPRNGDDKAPPLLDLLNKLGKQAEAFYKTASKVPLNGQDAAVVSSVNLCKSILETRQSMQARARTNPAQTPRTARPTTNATEAYRRACADVAYNEFPASLPVHYAFQFEASVVRITNPRRTITLAKELSTMATSLPPGIFVRSSPNRPDCIKALIVGPEGTPYYGGLFEFDIFPPGSYPQDPPEVRFKTTAQGRVRFNANLYEYVLFSPLLIIAPAKYVCL
jgi:baculoviral IAP repeat-containing protein 6